MFGLESIELPRRYDDYPRETFLEKYAKQIRIAKITILNGLFVAYFAWATFHYVHESKYALTKMLRIQSYIKSNVFQKNGKMVVKMFGVMDMACCLYL